MHDTAVQSDGEPLSRSVTSSLPLISLGRTSISLADALEEEEDVLVHVEYPRQRFDFFLWAQQHRERLAALVRHDLGMRAGESCELSHPREWIHGSFNVCIPVDITNWRASRVALRLPLPYKCGERQRPGNLDEKTRTEAATYLWISHNSPDVPIPRLWAFGLVGGRSFLRLENVSLYARLTWHLRRLFRYIAGRPRPQHQYVPTQRSFATQHSYLITDWVDGPNLNLLSRTWHAGCNDPSLRQNLFRSISRIMLSLSRTPLPWIGSFTLDEQGDLSLSNRPLLHTLHSLENGGVPTNIPRDKTYNSTPEFYARLLACHDNRINSQANSIMDEEDGQLQLGALFAMRGLCQTYSDPAYDQGPFNFTLTDLHASNMFVDQDWNVKCIVDLEWGCSLPREMLLPPSWISGVGIEDLAEQSNMEIFAQRRQEFMDAFELEERQQKRHGWGLESSTSSRTDHQPNFDDNHDQLTPSSPIPLTTLLHEAWHTGRFFFLHALTNTKGLYHIFSYHILPLFTTTLSMAEVTRCLAPFWGVGESFSSVIQRKVEDKRKYEKRIRVRFGEL